MDRSRAPMGWNSWDCYGAAVTEEIVRRNAAYMARRERALRWFSLQKCRWRDRKTHCYFACPKCGKTLRVPKGKGRVVITCAACGWQFERST